MSRFLLDANLSPQTATFLADVLGLEVAHLRDLAPGSPTDEEVVALAQRERRVVITFDSDFGEIYVLSEAGRLGVIVLELRDQTIENVHEVLMRFFARRAADIDLDVSLVVVEEHRVRVIRPT